MNRLNIARPKIKARTRARTVIYTYDIYKNTNNNKYNEEIN